MVSALLSGCLDHAFTMGSNHLWSRVWIFTSKQFMSLASQQQIWFWRSLNVEYLFWFFFSTARNWKKVFLTKVFFWSIRTCFDQLETKYKTDQNKYSILKLCHNQTSCCEAEDIVKIFLLYSAAHHIFWWELGIRLPGSLQILVTSFLVFSSFWLGDFLSLKFSVCLSCLAQ